jgi:hypothetical protein
MQKMLGLLRDRAWHDDQACGDDGRIAAVGRDPRGMATLQQFLVDT